MRRGTATWSPDSWVAREASSEVWPGTVSRPSFCLNIRTRSRRADPCESGARDAEGCAPARESCSSRAETQRARMSAELTRFFEVALDLMCVVGYDGYFRRVNPAFQEILDLGEEVVPLMLRDLQERPRLWVWALPHITGADPVPASDRGNIAKMS